MSKPEKNKPIRRGASLLDELGSKVGATGRVEDFYGGIRIAVLSPAAFPWCEILQRLTEAHQEVWVRRQDDQLEILSKSG